MKLNQKRLKERYHITGVSNNYSPTLLWTNPTPTTLSAGKISLDLSKYKGILIKLYQPQSNYNDTPNYVEIDMDTYIWQGAYANTNPSYQCRRVTTELDGVTFTTGWGWYKAATLFSADEWCVPNKIWGCLFEL